MVEFVTPIDIANRALGHCGAFRINPQLGFGEDSRNAAACQFAYGKLRRAELERNVWRFATKKTVLRAIDQNTMLLQPTLWSASTVYYAGAIVVDQNGSYWWSTLADNLGNQPGAIPSNSWEMYFGPLTASLYNVQVLNNNPPVPGQNNPIQPPTAYYAGEVVYLTPGDGSYKVYQSLVNSNTDNPGAPTLWSPSVIYDKDMVVTFYPAWSGGTTYALGQGVSFTDGNTYISLSAGNIGHSPASSPTFWLLYPSVILEWQPLQVYGLSSIVDFAGTLYLSKTSNHVGPTTPANDSNWAALTGGVAYLSLVDVNINQEPDLNAAAVWSSATTYAIGNTVRGDLDGVLYTSLTNGNLNNEPAVSPASWSTTGKLVPWTSTFTGGSGSMNWRQLPNMALTDLNLFYPIGVGPSTQSATRNIFRLPANYLRQAPQDPKAGSTSYLGAPSGLGYNDWEFESNYLISREVFPIPFRFVADVTNVPDMNSMFCEGLAARIGMEICEELTQSAEKIKTIASAYQKFMGEARTVNAIETGAVEPPEDDFITCRL